MAGDYYRFLPATTLCTQAIINRLVHESLSSVKQGIACALVNAHLLRTRCWDDISTAASDGLAPAELGGGMEEQFDAVSICLLLVLQPQRCAATCERIRQRAAQMRNHYDASVCSHTCKRARKHVHAHSCTQWWHFSFTKTFPGTTTSPNTTKRMDQLGGLQYAAVRVRSIVGKASTIMVGFRVGHARSFVGF